MEGYHDSHRIRTRTNSESFENLTNWIEKLLSVEPESIIMIIGNKSDLVEHRKIETETRSGGGDGSHVSAGGYSHGGGGPSR